VAIMDFCKDYNARTEDRRGQIVPVEITIYEDRSFTYVTKTPPTSFLIRRAAGIESAAHEPGREAAGSITEAQVTEIAETKMPDLNANDLDAARLQIRGTARSMGVEVR
jgi:large subunit ribosomal protein L11